MTFSVETLIEECRSVIVRDDAHAGIRDILRRTLDRPDVVAEALGRPDGGAHVLFASEELTVLNALWPPHISLYPHEHRMVATIGVYAGVEANTFFRRAPERIERSGERLLDTADVFTLGRDAIHAVDNPTDRWTGAIHVYSGDFLHIERSQWNAVTLAEEPYNLEQVGRVFAEATERWRTATA